VAIGREGSRIEHLPFPVVGSRDGFMPRRWGQLLTANHFRTFSQNGENGFAAFINCFISLS
jgi:hypothetical protein